MLWWFLLGVGLGGFAGYQLGLCYLSYVIASFPDKEIKAEIESLMHKVIDYQVRTRNR